MLKFLYLTSHKFHFEKLLCRLIDAETIAKFQLLLSAEYWKSIYNNDNIDSIFMY
jgi:hypothetical protein